MKKNFLATQFELSCDAALALIPHLLECFFEELNLNMIENSRGACFII